MPHFIFCSIFEQCSYRDKVITNKTLCGSYNSNRDYINVDLDLKVIYAL